MSNGYYALVRLSALFAHGVALATLLRLCIVGPANPLPSISIALSALAVIVGAVYIRKEKKDG